MVQVSAPAKRRAQEPARVLVPHNHSLNLREHLNQQTYRRIKAKVTVLQKVKALVKRNPHP